MRKMVWGLLVVVLLGAPILCLAQTTPALRENVLIRSSWGDGPEDFGRPPNVKGLFSGPLFDVSGGMIYVMDRVKTQLRFYGATGTLVRSDSLPSDFLLDAPQTTDLRVLDGKAFFLIQDTTTAQVRTYDLATRAVAEVDVQSLDTSKSGNKDRLYEVYKLFLAPEGLYLLHRVAQKSLLFYDQRPIPLDQQVWEDGISVGGKRIRWGIPFGPVTSAAGDTLVPGDWFFFAAGDSCMLISLRSQSQFLLNLYSTSKGMLSSTPRPKREPSPASNVGTRYRIEDGYYELYSDDKQVVISRWPLK